MTATAWPSALLLVGVLVSIVADLTFDLVLLETGARVKRGWTDAVYLIVYLLLVASAELYWRHPVPARRAARPGASAQPSSSPLPYLAIGATYGLLLLAALEPGPTR